MICQKCDKKGVCTSPCSACRKEEWSKIIVKVKCIKCNKETATNKFKWEYKHKNRGGLNCRKCCSKISSKWMKEYKASISKEKRIEEAKIGRNNVKDVSAAVRKQWETIRADPELKTKKYKKLKQQAQDFWDNVDDETRERILSSWLSEKSRSKVSEELKQAMIKDGLFKGFKSEQYFHGFFPDEINHELKIIVEMYGDLYHCNPRKYKDPDQYLKTIGRTVGEQWQRDRRRLGCFYKHGYEVVIVWEKDFRNDPKKQLERIKKVIDNKKK